MLKEIPWRRGALESVVIVGSILLAFGIQAWWDGLQEENRRVEVVTTIRASAEASHDSVQSLIAAIERDQEDVARFFETPTTESNAIPRDSVLQAIATLTRAYAGDVTPGPLIGVTNSAELALIGDAELRGLLQQWGLAVTSLDQIAANSSLAELRAIETFASHPGFQDFFLGGSAPTALDLNGVRADPEVKAAVATVVFQRGLYMFVLGRHLKTLEDIASAAESVLSR